MAASSRAKASDKQDICRKLVTALKKRYKGPVPKHDRPALETMLYAACLENATDEQADAAFARLHSEFHDLNEIRVSSVSELAAVFAGTDDPERRAVQLRAILQHVFEKHYAFDLEPLKKKTQEQAVKQLDKIRELSYFVRAFTLQEALGSHAVPVDDRTARAAIWLGLADPQASPEEVSNTLRTAVRKPDAPLFCFLLRSFANDPAVRKKIGADLNKPPEEGFDLTTAPARLTALLGGGESKPAAPRKAAAGKKRTKPAAEKKSAGTSAGRSAAKKKTTRKPKTATG